MARACDGGGLGRNFVRESNEGRLGFYRDVVVCEGKALGIESPKNQTRQRRRARAGLLCFLQEEEDGHGSRRSATARGKEGSGWPGRSVFVRERGHGPFRLAGPAASAWPGGWASLFSKKYRVFPILFLQEQ
jgi:hypothetical protein